MSLLRLDSSIRTENSVSREITDVVERAYREARPEATVVRRDLGVQPVPIDLWNTGVVAGAVADSDRTPEQQAAVRETARLADEAVAADALVIGPPLYNFNVAAHLKTWVDTIVTDARFAPGATPLAGKPVVLVVSRGGGYGPGTPREGWDHGTGWLVRMFGDVWGGDVSVIEAELTLADVVPAMSELRPLAAENRDRARAEAQAAGARCAGAVAVA
ncbi:MULTISPECIES: FMN-dependent NADH-azoreductase [unclassified Pseudonocardia]|uniref:FMN-dependent NADH-azoreductase n=1 Tax=unclassified Pseudonocardia TaxID=2619320 RepID=UPI00094B7475|nr:MULTISPECIES: NAD(P)H-dependent oxidoreductase [unclassified Pseudonocardia]